MEKKFAVSYIFQAEIQVSLVFVVLVQKEMKCLLCSSKFKDDKELLDHYLSYHNIDENN